MRLIDSCITQLKAQGPSRACNESKEEEEGGGGRTVTVQEERQEPFQKLRLFSFTPEIATDSATCTRGLHCYLS